MNVAKRASVYQMERPIRATTGRRSTKQRHRRVLSPMAQITIAGVVIALLLLTYVTEKNIVMSYGYQLDNLQNRLEELQIQRDRLALQVMDLSSLERIDQVARAQLGMVTPKDVKYVALAPPQDMQANPGSERFTTQIAEYVSDFFTSVAKAAGLYEGR